MIFAASLSLCFSLLPLVAAVVHDVQVGAGGQLAFDPEAIVRRFFNIPSPFISFISLLVCHRR